MQNLSLKSAHAIPTLSPARSYASPRASTSAAAAVAAVASTSSASTSQNAAPLDPNVFRCHVCQFTTTRLNVIIIHNKMHAAETPPKSFLDTAKTSGKVSVLCFNTFYVNCFCLPIFLAFTIGAEISIRQLKRISRL